MPRATSVLFCLIIAGAGCTARVPSDRRLNERPQMHLQRLRADECGTTGRLYYRLRYWTDKVGGDPHVQIELINRLGPDCFIHQDRLEASANYSYDSADGEWFSIGGGGGTFQLFGSQPYKRLSYWADHEALCNCKITAAGRAPLHARTLTDRLTISKRLGAFLPTADGRHRDVVLIIEASLPVADIDGIERWTPADQRETKEQSSAPDSSSATPSRRRKTSPTRQTPP